MKLFSCVTIFLRFFYIFSVFVYVLLIYSSINFFHNILLYFLLIEIILRLIYFVIFLCYFHNIIWLFIYQLLDHNDFVLLLVGCPCLFHNKSFQICFLLLYIEKKKNNFLYLIMFTCLLKLELCCVPKKYFINKYVIQEYIYKHLW